MAGTLTASVIKNDTTSPPVFQNSAGTEIGTLCRAWVNFNGTVNPSTISASFNVSSVTYNGTGNYTVNFTNALPDTNYAYWGQTRREIAGFGESGVVPGLTDTKTTTALQVRSGFSTTALSFPEICVSVFR